MKVSYLQVDVQHSWSNVLAKLDGKSLIKRDLLIFSTDGSIKVDYGYTNRPGTDGPSKSFHTRQITFPILFTVYHTFEPHSLDILRFEPTQSKSPEIKKSLSLGVPPTPRRTSFANTADDSLKKRLQDEADDEHCLVSLSVRNVHGVPFEVNLERRGEDPSKLSSPLHPDLKLTGKKRP
jgi:hypothetical protein